MTTNSMCVNDATFLSLNWILLEYDLFFFFQNNGKLMIWQHFEYMLIVDTKYMDLYQLNEVNH